MVRLFYSSNRTVESYFWEARRILEGDDEKESGLSPRESFIQAVAGQPPQGYERMVLERGAAPTQFADSVRAVEEDRANRQAQIERYSGIQGRPTPSNPGCRSPPASRSAGRTQAGGGRRRF